MPKTRASSEVRATSSILSTTWCGSDGATRCGKGAGWGGKGREGAGWGAQHELHEEPQCVRHLQSQLQPLQVVSQHSHHAAIALCAATTRAARAARADARRRERGMEAPVPPGG